MRRLILCLLLLSTVALVPSVFADCKVEESREAGFDALSIRKIEIRARAGSLEVKGVPGASRIEARGTVCASSADLAGKVRLITEGRGDTGRVVVEIPDHSGRRRYARLDLTVEIPANLPVEIDDSSGSIEIRGVAAAVIDDGSGSIRAQEIGGDLEIEDGSGEIKVRDIAGDLTVDDGSGGIDARRIGGSVMIEEDGSGGIELVDVDGDVMVREDGSGGISVNGVGGDFTVRRDGSGGIDHRGVRGRVAIPEDD